MRGMFSSTRYKSALKSPVSSVNRKDRARNRKGRGSPTFKTGRLASMARKTGSFGTR
jgi:hypothetical protein